MAIYHFSIHNKKRTLHGGNAVSHLAYINAEKYMDIENGRIRNYTKKKNVVFTETLIPDNAPLEYKDPVTLWNAVQKIEKNKNARLYREIEIALPKEFDTKTNISLAREMAESLVKDGMCVSLAVHDVEGNPHAHIMCTTRSLDSNGKWLPKQQKVYLDKNGNVAKTKKDRIYDKKKKQYKCTSIATNDWNTKEALNLWRERWEIMQNNALEREGYNVRVSRKSLKEQGIDRLPGIHEGVGRALEKKGIKSYRVAENNEIKKINKQYSEAMAQKQAIADERLAVLREMEMIDKDIASIEGKIKDMQLAEQQAAFLNNNRQNVVYGEGFKKPDTQNERQKRAIKLLYNFLESEKRNINKQYSVNVSDSDIRQMEKQADDFAISEYRSKKYAENRLIIDTYNNAKSALEAFELSPEHKKIKDFEAMERPSMLKQPKKYWNWLDRKEEYESNIEAHNKTHEKLATDYNKAKTAYDNIPSLKESDILSISSVKTSAEKHFNTLFNNKKSSLNSKLSVALTPVNKAMDTVTGLFNGINYNVGLNEKDEQLAIFELKEMFFSNDKESKSQDLQDLKEISNIISKVLPTGSTLLNKFKGAINAATADLSKLAEAHKDAPVNPAHRPQQPPPPRSR